MVFLLWAGPEMLNGGRQELEQIARNQSIGPEAPLGCEVRRQPVHVGTNASCLDRKSVV